MVFQKIKKILKIHISFHFWHLFNPFEHYMSSVRHCLLSTFRAIRRFVPFDIFSFDILSHSVFFHSTFCPIRCFSIQHFVLFGVFSIRRFFHSTFCPIRPFVPFDVSSIRCFVPFGVFSIRRFVPFGVLSFDVLSFDVLSIRRLWLWHFVGEPYCVYCICFYKNLNGIYLIFFSFLILGPARCYINVPWAGFRLEVVGKIQLSHIRSRTRQPRQSTRRPAPTCVTSRKIN